MRDKAWRRFRGRRWRQQERIAREKAALIIQEATRAFLVKHRAVRDRAARLIQRKWRKTLFFRFCLLKIKFRRPLRDLHAAARTVQRKFRRYQIAKQKAKAKDSTNAEGLFIYSRSL